MSGSGPGSAGQHEYNNPANFFNSPPQQDGGSAHNFFDQHHQGAPSQPQNWYPQQPGPPPGEQQPGPPPGEQPTSAATAPVFYNPSEYSKGVAAQPPVPFNPFPQAEANHQQQQPQQPEGIPHQMNNEDYPNSGNQWYQHENAVDPTRPQEWNNPDSNHSQEWNHPQQADQNHGYGGGANMYDQAEGQAPDSTYNQQPYYSSQQSNDSTASHGQPIQANVDQVGAPNNHWDQPPPNAARDSAAESAWNHPNPANQLSNNAPLDNSSGSIGNTEQNAAKANPIHNEDDAGSGYLGFFHNDDNESDFAESDRTESAEDANQQEPSTAPPVGSGSSAFHGNAEPLPQNVPSSLPEGVVPHGQIPANEQNQYPYSQPLQAEGQEFGPPPDSFDSSVNNSMGMSANQLVDPPVNRNDNAQSAYQPFQQMDIPQEDYYLQNQGYPTPQSYPSDTRPDAQPELQTDNYHDGAGLEAGLPASEHSSISSSLPPSDPSADSASTSRSNSLLGEGGMGSAASSSIGISTSHSHETIPVVEPLQEQRGDIIPSVEGQLPIGHQHQPLHNVQEVAPPPPNDVSQQNSAMSEVSSSISVPSTLDTDVSRTGGGSLLAESEQQFNQETVESTQSIPYEQSGIPAAHAQQPASAHQTIPVTNTLPGYSLGGIQQPTQPSGLDLQQLPANPIEPQHSPVNPLSPISTAPVNVPVSSAPPVLAQSQGSQPASPMLETNPLFPGASHPSAFHKVKGHQPQKPVATSAAVNPSPPLWSTEVPPLPSNILLAPAVPSGNTPRLVAPSPQPAQPIIVDGNLAASIANVSVPPPPTLQGHNPATVTHGPSVPSFAGQNVPNVEQVTRNMAGLTVGPTSQPVLLPPASGPEQLVTTPLGRECAPSVPAKSVQSLPSLSQSTGSAGQIAIAASPSAPSISAQGSPVKVVQPAVTVLTGGQMPPSSQTTAPPTSVAAQNSGQYAQQGPAMQQQYAPNQQQQQLPAGQEQWYGNTGQPYPYNPQQPQQYPYQQHPDYRSQYEYDAYYRQYPKQQQQQQHYRDQRPYSRQGYEQQERASYRDRDPARSYSRQGYEQQQDGLRWSRRAGYDTNYDAYYKGYSKRDPRNRDYADYEAYQRKHGYHRDPRYEEYYRNKEQQHQSSRSRGQEQHNTSGGIHVSRSDTSLDHTLDRSANATASQQERSFSKEFHHTGGDTPEKYGADQSGIVPRDTPGTGEHGGDQRQYGRRGYGEYGSGQYDASRGQYDNGYSSTDGSWNQYQYGYGADGSYTQEPAKPATPPPPQRLTPARFSRPHVGARFSSGGHLIKILPNNPVDGQPATVEIHSIEAMLEHREEYTELKAFPGPLVRNETHKNDVVRFALQKVEACRKSEVYDKHSAALLWDLMVLLCRQNGSIVGTDISELLLRDHPMTTSLPDSPPPAPAQPVAAQPVAATGEETEADADTKEGEVEEVPKTTVIAQQQSIKKAGPDVEKETHRFRELLLFGRKKEALDSAIKGGLWGHALLLACKMDHRTHLSVMTRFANSLPMNDPLQTLYQLMSNRQPAAVTSCSDEKWGDWRPHLAMILSNLISNADLDVKSITSLGDSLAARDLLHASHFCYLMAQIGLGHYSKKSTKMVLLGARHGLPFNEFARQTPIQQTEVYEYAQSLNNKRYFLPTFQVYKLIYATHLLDYGLVSQALHYCEVIAIKIQYSPAYFSPTLIKQVSELSHRLKYHDPQYFDGREVTEPDWLRELDHIKIQYEEGAIQPSSATDTPMPWVESSSNLSTMGEGSVSSEGLSFEVTRTNAAAGQPPRMVGTPMSDDYGMVPSMDQQQQQQGDQGYGQQQQQYGAGEGQQYGEGGMQQDQQQYGDGGQQYDGSSGVRQQQYGISEQNAEGQQQTGAGTFKLDQSGYYQPADPNANSNYQGGGQQTDQQQTAQGGYDWSNQQQQQYSEMGTEAIPQGGPADGGYQQPQTGGNYANFGTQPPPDNTKPPNLDLGASHGSNFSEYSTTSAATTTDGWATDNDQPDSGATEALDYYGQSTNMPNKFGGPPSPVETLTPPDTPISRTRTRTLSENSQTRETAQFKKPQPKPEKPKQKKDVKSKQQKKGGWLSGWFGKKDMHLPDDKDKQIQWDETKKRWVNTEESDDESGAPPPPPPKDHEFSGGSAPQNANGPPGGPGPQSGAPPPGVNKFSRKTAGRGKNYVDIFNQGSTMPAKPSSMPPPSKIFDPLPSSNAMPMNFFVPQGGNVSGDEAGTGQQQQVSNPDSRAETPATPRSRQNSGQPQQTNQTQQYFNPNAYGGPGGAGGNFPVVDPTPAGHQELNQQQEDNLSRTSSMSSLSQEVSQHMNNQSGQSRWQQEEPAAPAPAAAVPAPVTAAPPLTQPMMYNPTQFPQPSFPDTPQQQGPKRGYGARRQYPGKR